MHLGIFCTNETFPRSINFQPPSHLGNFKYSLSISHLLITSMKVLGIVMELLVPLKL